MAMAARALAQALRPHLDPLSSQRMSPSLLMTLEFKHPEVTGQLPLQVAALALEVVLAGNVVSQGRK